MTNVSLPPALLCIGVSSKAIAFAQQYIMKALCLVDGCGECLTCKQIIQRQHHALLWLSPEKQFYSVDQIDEVLYNLSFKLDDQAKHFIVFESADLLTLNTGNRLLKILEEPPRGYHFILLAGSSQQLLPTIVSRCVICKVEGVDETTDWDDFLSLFTPFSSCSFMDFNKKFDAVQPNEAQSRIILDTLIASWHEHSMVAQKNNHENNLLITKAVLSILSKALSQQPMPGSAKLFWRNLFLELTLSRSYK